MRIKTDVIGLNNDENCQLRSSLQRELDRNLIVIGIKRVTCLWLSGFMSKEDFVTERGRLFEAFRNVRL